MSSSPVPIDPALQAEDEAYRSSLSGIYASRPTGPTNLNGQGSSSSGIERSDREVGTPDPIAGGGKKKRKVDDDEARQKKSRQSQSCDACRARKVKCDRPPPNPANNDPDAPTKEVCTHCAHLHLACTFDYVPKKRGPPNLYLRKIQQGDKESASPGPSKDHRPRPSHGSAPSPSHRYGASESPSDSHHMGGRYSDYPQSQSQSDNQNHSHNPYLAFEGQYGRSSPGRSNHQYSPLSEYIGGGSSGNHAWNGGGNSHSSMLMTLASASQPPPPPSRPGVPPSSSHSFTETNPYPSPRITTHRPSFTGGTHKPLPQRPFEQSSPLATSSIGKSSPGYQNWTQYPNNPNNPFDVVMPRGLLYYIVDLYFDYIYALIPCLHKPSFMASLHDGREERPNEDEWVALVMAVVAGTLVQVPHAFVAIPKEEKKVLTQRCYALVKEFLNKDFTEVTVSRCIIYYLTAFTARILGYPTVAAMYFTCNIALVVRMRLNEEATYQNLSPVYRELCRRIFWLAYGGDKSMASMDGEAVFISEDECADVALPAEVDDEYVGESDYYEQPAGRTSVLSGFVYISKLFRIIGQFLNKKRGDRRKPLSGVMLQMRLNEVADLYERVQTLMHNCPEVLKLDVDSDSKSVTSISEDWDIHASADIQNLFFDPKAPKAVIRDAYLVQQGNIYVTQQMARQMILQYRDELLSLQANELALESSSLSDPTMMSSGSRRMAEWTKALIPDDKDQIASDLLAVLQKIPITVIAVNSTSMMAKIRYVASSLLDTLSSPSGDVNGINSDLPVRLQKAQSYLWDFLRILSEIEALYLLCDEQKGQLAR